MLKPIADTEYIFRFLNQNEFIETCDRRYLEPVRGEYYFRDSVIYILFYWVGGPVWKRFRLRCKTRGQSNDL